MSRFTTVRNLFRPRSRRQQAVRRRDGRWGGGVAAGEQLESRSMLAVTIGYSGGTLSVDITGSDNSVFFEFGVFADPAAPATPATLGARVSSSSNPATYVYSDVFEINVSVATPASATGNRASFGIVPFDSAFTSSSFVFEGNGTTGSGFFACTTSTVKSLAGINLSDVDVVSFSQANEIRLDGAFTNDTDDATIEVAYQSYRPDTTEVILGTNRPLVADYVRVESSKAITFFNPVTATQDAILRTGSVLDLDYDVTAGRRLVLDGTNGITQRASSTIVASTLEVVNRAGTVGTSGDIDLGSAENDFDSIYVTSATTGKVGIRDRDDLAVRGYGILATTGQVVLDARGALTIDSTIKADGLFAQSGAGITSTANAVLQLGAQGITLLANDSFDDTSTGDISLGGLITVDATLVDSIVRNRIEATGTVTVAGGLYSPLAGSTTLSGANGVVVAAPVQVGSSKLNATGDTLTVYDHDLILTAAAGGITVSAMAGGDAVPRALQATNIISFDAANSVSIAGAVFAGTLYGNPSALVETKALPAITVVAGGSVDIAATGSLITSTYQSSADTSPNPLLGRISISGASQVNQLGVLKADGAIDIDIVGDIYLTGQTGARESIRAATSTGSIDVQGAVRATGYTYTSTPAAPILAQRTPNVILSAPLGGISTTGLGTLSAGTMVVGQATTYGEVRLDAQQDIDIGAAIDTAGGVRATSALGAFTLDALLRTGVNIDPALDNAAVIRAALGISTGEFGRIDTEFLDVGVTNAAATADIVLVAPGNQIAKLSGFNFSPDGKIEVANGVTMTVSDMAAYGDIAVTSAGRIDVVALMQSTGGNIGITSSGNGVNVQGTVLAPAGTIAINAAGQIVQRGGNVVQLYLLSGGRDYSYAVVTIEAPPGAGDPALATATITPYPSPPGNGVKGTITGLTLIDGGWGYPSGSRVNVTITGDGAGAAAVARTGIVTSSIEARDNVTLTSGDGVTLVSAVRSAIGAVEVVATRGDVSVESLTAGGAVDVTANRGKVTLVSVAAGGDATLTADQGLNVTGSLSSAAGNIEITTTNGDLTFSNDPLTGAGGDAVISAKAGTVALTSLSGAIVAPYVINASGNVTLTAFLGVSVNEELKSDAGAISVTSAAGAVTANNLLADLGVSVVARGTVTLLGVAGSEAGDVSIKSTSGDLDFTASGAQIHALDGGVALEALNGTIMSPPTLHVGKNATLTSFNTLVLNNEITSDTGVIDLKSTSGSINLGANIDARDDSIRLNAKGSITQIGGGIGYVRVLTGGSGYTAATTVTIAAPSGGGVAARAVPIIATVKGVRGVITGIRLLSPGSGYGAGEQAAITFGSPGSGATAFAVASPALGNSGLAAIDVLAGGSGYNATTTVTIAAPAGGGTAATAQAVIGTVVGDDGTTTEGVIIDIVIVNPGSGYGAGEQPAVTITGPGTGAVARAIANITLQDIRAGKNIDIAAGTGVTLLNTIRADQGSVSITSEAGNVNLAARTLLVSSFTKDIGITARRGAISVQRLAADGDITLKAQTGVTLLNAVNSTGEFDTGDVSIYTVNGNIAAVAPNGLISVQNGGVSLESVNGSIFVPQVFNVTGDISLKTYGAQTINQALKSSAGSITVASAAGAVNLAANVFADNRITLNANAGILQTKGFVQAAELVVANKSALPVVLGAQQNNVDRFAGTSIGGITYVDADSFETGVLRGGVLGDQVVEVITNGSLTLQAGTLSSGPLRIVGGVKAASKQLFLSSGSAAIPGVVEYVVTSDKSASATTFSGSLANMISLSNANQARFNGTVVPQAIVFDADGYAIETVTVNALLPTVTQAVTIDGTETESTVAIERVEITRGASGPANGLVFAAGSAGSEVTGLSVTGFNAGAGITLLSTGTTVTDTFLGVKRDGTLGSKNLVGIDISGTAATGNTIGGTPAERGTPEEGTANVFGGNSVGIRVRGGATGNTIAGNFVGTDALGTKLGNTVGVHILNAVSTVVSDNLIANNTDGIQIQARATDATANQVKSNVIVGNTAGAGIRLTASSFAVIGGVDAANTIGKNRIGVVVAQTSTSNTITANYIGTDADGTDLGNTTDGVQVIESIGNTIGGSTSTDGNMIAKNLGVGVLLQNSLASTAAAGNRVLSNTVDANKSHGIRVLGGGRATISANTITANGNFGTKTGNGIDISPFTLNGKAFGSVENILRSNLVGTTSANDMIDAGNAGVGISITGGSGNVVEAGNVVRFNAKGMVLSNTSSNMIGSRLAGQGNVISDNDGVGIEINGGSKDNMVSGNTIERNDSNGILVTVLNGSTPTGTVIGDRSISGKIVSIGNAISGNTGFGVSIAGGAQAVQAIGNSMTGNTSGGISPVAGVNIPSLTSAIVRYNSGAGNQLLLNGTVRGTPRQQVLVDVYSTPKLEYSASAPTGKRFLGRVTVLVGADGVGMIKDVLLPLNGTVAGDVITATATTLTTSTTGGMISTPIGTTSAFSNGVTLMLPPPTTATTPTSTKPTRGTPTSRA